MKIGIWDGCANGGMMDSLNIKPFEPGDGEPYVVCEIDAVKWMEWEKFVKLHNTWEQFWDKQLLNKANRYKPNDK